MRKHRRLAGLSQKEATRRLQLQSNSMLSRWERGFAMPSAENLLRLSALYKTLANKLYFDLFVEYRHELFDKQKNADSNAP